MHDHTVYHRINQLAQRAKYPLEMNSIADIESFLGDESNTRLEFYEELEQLYSQLMDDVAL